MKILKGKHMPKRIFEFVCVEGHITDAYIDSETRITKCIECGNSASRIISTPMVKLEGVTGAFPGAAMRWEQKRNEKIKAEKRSAG